MKAGSIVYFKHGKLTSKGQGKKHMLEFKGHGFGVYLGHVPPFMPDPPLDIVVSCLGAIGYTKLDDIKEFLGEEVMQDFLKKWQAKYTAKIDELAKRAVQSGALKLFGPDGKPLQKLPPRLSAVQPLGEKPKDSPDHECTSLGVIGTCGICDSREPVVE